MIYVALIARPFATFQAEAVLAYLRLLVLQKLLHSTEALLSSWFIGIEKSGGLNRKDLYLKGNYIA